AYDENAGVTLQLKVFPYQHDTEVSVDWGDGKTDKVQFKPKEITADAIFTFSHKYAKNGTYKISFRAVNAVTSNSLETEVNITNKVPEPKADFSYEVLENGKVRFKNLSPEAGLKYYWNDTKTQNRSRLANPEFIYERNDSYPVFLTVEDKYGQKTTITKNVSITNAVTKETASFKGTILNEQYSFSEDGNECRTMLSETDPLSTKILNTIVLNVAGKKIEMTLNGMFHVLGSANPDFSINERVEKFRQYLVPGIKKIGVQTHDQWNASVKYENNGGTVIKQFTEVPDAQIEITDVKEIEQPALFDGLYKQAFWVTFKLKADFKQLGKIDGTLKIRYLVYRMD
ncbi:PKD domain-containing protein, partial [Emticicia agri]